MAATLAWRVFAAVGLGAAASAAVSTPQAQSVDNDAFSGLEEELRSSSYAVDLLTRLTNTPSIRDEDISYFITEEEKSILSREILVEKQFWVETLTCTEGINSMFREQSRLKDSLHQVSNDLAKYNNSIWSLQSMIPKLKSQSGELHNEHVQIVEDMNRNYNSRETQKQNHRKKSAMISRALSYCKHKLLDNDDADAINTNNHDLPLSLETALSEALSATETASNIADHSTQIHRKRTLSPNRRRHRIHFAGEKTAVIKEKTVESAEEEGQHRKDIITWIVENDQSSSSRVPNPNGVWERVVDGFAQYKAWLKQEEKQNLINSIQTNDENLEKLQVAKRKNLEGSRQWLDSVHELSATKPFVEGLLVSNKRYSEALSSATNRLRDFINDCDSKAKNHTRIRNQISNELGSLRKIRKLLAIPDPKPDVAVIGTCGIQANNTGGQDTCALNATQNTVVPDVIRVSYKVKQPKFSNLDYANYEPPFFPAMELSEVTGRAMNAL